MDREEGKIKYVIKKKMLGHILTEKIFGMILSKTGCASFNI